MKRIMTVAVLMGLLASGASALITVNWDGTANPGTVPPKWLYNNDGSDLPLANSPAPGSFPNGTYSSWEVQLISYTGAMDWNALYNQYGLGDFSLGGNESQLDTGSFEGDFANPNGVSGLGFFETALVDAAKSGESLYVRFFDADTEGNAAQAGFVYDTAWLLPADDQAIALDIFFNSGTSQGTLKDAGGVGPMDGTSGWYTVAAVPEPGTMALLGLGMVVLAYRRRR
jgi:hypothetical protein